MLPTSLADSAKRARQLLDGRIAVELERIEVGATGLLFLVPMQDLRFGLELELAQLFLQARDGAAELGEVEIDRADLLLQARAEDADFAGVVEQRVEQVGVDAREFLALLRLRLATRQRQALRARPAALRASSALGGNQPRSIRHVRRRIGRSRISRGASSVA